MNTALDILLRDLAPMMEMEHFERSFENFTFKKRQDSKHLIEVVMRHRSGGDFRVEVPADRFLGSLRGGLMGSIHLHAESCFYDYEGCDHD